MTTKRRTPPDNFTIYTTNIMLRGVPVDLRDGFKAYCARRGITMKQRLLELMQLDVNEELKSIKKIKRKG